MKWPFTTPPVPPKEPTRTPSPGDPVYRPHSNGNWIYIGTVTGLPCASGMVRVEHPVSEHVPLYDLMGILHEDDVPVDLRRCGCGFDPTGKICHHSRRCAMWNRRHALPAHLQ